ncbi:hypothetical protein V518_0108 [Thermoanaerobacterium aotearoense SCUT27]|uniref:UPF0182 protein V518_0108 n=2 Tax=Thermoanaerobacterium TaxID=28895 RepID=W9EC73_9THEO|nr:MULTISPECIES: UPF0182 family protein [Thermoanaerobacterium]AFK85606.1 UPF0182 protein [Thermoanaerobacterium saccharolyticum JW/SL-YS485]ETO39677.1 hypothetical protein V518_0108 [Thermoanaerobacterium aotearoense SCUT27]
MVICLKRGNLAIIILLISIFLIAALFASLANLIVDIQWFNSLNYLGVFFKKFLTQLTIGVPSFVVIFILSYFYLNRMVKDYAKFAQDIEIKSVRKRFRGVVIGLSIFVSFLISVFISANWWNDFLFYINSANFGVKDPIFNKDISLYMFRLPFLLDVYDLLIVIIPILIVATIIVYGLMYLSDKTRFYEISDRGGFFRAIYNKEILMIAFRQIAVLGFVFFAVLSLGYYLKAYGILYSKSGVVFGAGYTDVHVRLLFYRILMLASIISGVLFMIGAFRQKLKYIIASPVIIVAIMILSTVSQMVVQNFIVAPNELDKEKTYLKYNIDFTQKAFDLNNVEERNYDLSGDIDKKVLDENQDTINNIRINDYRPVSQIYNQLQSIRLYYKFNDIDIDRYMINGNYRQVFISAREMNLDNLASQAKNWINMHLKYTHGYGVVMSTVNDVTATGQPDMVIKNIPPVSSTNIKITRPEIYFGELTNTYAIVNTKTGEFDYPAGDTNKENFYSGKSGIPMTFLNKLLYTIYTGNIKILLSTDITADSRMLLFRNIKDRVQRIAPFLIYDDDPYIVVDNGKLYWMIDAYTYSGNYPYSEPYGDTGINYIRNSVKVVVDAYTGDVKYYISDKNDPIIKVYSRIFPGLFKNIDEMPQGLKAHIRYPQYMFDIQASVYKNYHMSDPQVFYNKEDSWDIAKEKFTGKIEPEESQYVIMKLPGEKTAEYVLMIPYTPATKDNMVAWMAARMDGNNYGKLVVYKFPKSTVVYGPMQIENMIDQDPNISKEMSLWDQKGSSIIRGNLLTLPIDDSMLYVEPIYIQSSNENAIPEVKRVILAYKDKIVMEDTLANALNKLFNLQTPAQPQVPQVQTNETQQELIKKANDIYNNAMNASKNGDWTDFGKNLDELGSVLNDLNNSIKK